jgi:hypothetical protein
MSTIITNPFSINGVISTDKTVMQNLNDLCSASSAWLTYDISDGKWAVIINRSGLPTIANFNDSNIIGAINVNDTGINELYNSVSVEYPNKDIRDDRDYVDIKLDNSVKYPNEVDNTLNMQFDCINNQSQAQILGSIELKQSRLNKIIEFQTDFSNIGLKAGDIITVSSSIYGFTNKKFRIISMAESDTEVISISIVAQEYNESVYDTSGLNITLRQKSTGIILKSQNTAIQASNDADVGGSMQRLLLANLGLKLLNKLFSKKTNPDNPRAPSIFEPLDKIVDSILSSVKKPDLETISGPTPGPGPDRVCAGTPITYTVEHNCSSCLFDIPPIEYPYTITGVDETDISMPLSGTITVTDGVGNFNFVPSLSQVPGSFKTATITIGNLTRVCEIYNQKDYTYSIASSATSITEGQSVTITLTATGSKANATIPYAITGSAISKVTSPALTGTVTTVGGTATLTIVTSDDAIVTGPEGLTVTFEPGLVDPCNTVGNNASSVTILDNDVAPPPPTTCSYIQVPLVWCGEFNGTDDQLQALTALDSINLPVPRAGEATVALPATLTVTKGNPSTIVVATTVNVASVALQAAMGGRSARIITTFDPVPPLGLIKGTGVTVYGF